jgi:uncharacterized membrane protein
MIISFIQLNWFLIPAFAGMTVEIMSAFPSRAWEREKVLQHLPSLPSSAWERDSVSATIKGSVIPAKAGIHMLEGANT